MKFFKVLPKENKILRAHVKNKSSNSLHDFSPVTLLKRDSNTVVFLWIFQKSYEKLFL